MRIEVTKGSDRDFIEVHRADGSVESTSFPKKGTFPHDVIHLIVETELCYQSGFWGRIAAGSHPEEVAALAKTGGHYSASRAEIPAQEIVQLIHAERIVECFEAELWTEPSEVETFQAVLRAACQQSKVGTPMVSELSVRHIRKKLGMLKLEWQSMKMGQSLTLHWV